MASMKDLFKIKVIFEGIDPKMFEVATGLSGVQQIVALIAAAAPIPHALWADPKSIEQNISAALYQDDDAHETCTLTACLNPLHPGPCKGWKGALHDVSPAAWHALEAARVEKANHRRIAKIEALKSAGKPIPHKLLQPILPKAHPNAGKTAAKASGDAHIAGQEVSANAGVHVSEPGKVTLGQAVKPIPQNTGEKGPKGKKPTVASKGIAFVIAQEKVTPQYKLDKAASITPEQWKGLSEADQSVIRGELAKIKIDGFGPQQKKADELLSKLPVTPPEPTAAEKAVSSSPMNQKVQAVKSEVAKGSSLAEAIKKVNEHQAANAAFHKQQAEAAKTPIKLPEPEAPKAAPEKLGAGKAAAPIKVSVADVKVGDVVKSNLISGDYTVAKITNPSTSLKNTHVTYEFHDATGKTFFVGHKNAKATLAPKPEAPKAETPKATLKDAVAKQSARAAEDTIKGRAHIEEAAKAAHEAKIAEAAAKQAPPEGVSMTPGNLGKLIHKQGGSADVTIGGKKINVGFEGDNKEAKLTFTPKLGSGGGGYHITTKDGEKHYIDKNESVTVHPNVPAVKAPEKPTVEEKPKPLPKHVTDAIAMAKGQAPGASWSKNHLAAYQPLTAEEYKALPPDVQDKIISELTKGQSKFLDPKKVKASQDLIDKFKGAGGAPKAEAPKTATEVGFVKDLHNHAVSDAEAKKIVAATPIGTQFLAAKQIAGLTQKDNPDAFHLHAEAADTAASALVQKHTAIYTGPVLKDPAVAEAKKALFKAAWDQANAESILKSKQQAFSKIAMKTKGDNHGLSPIEKATLVSVGAHMLEHNTPDTSVSTMDKLKADTKSAEQELDHALQAALKKANAPSAANMSNAQIADQAVKLLGPLANNPKASLNLNELQYADKIGKLQVEQEAKKYPPEVLTDPAVAAKMGKYQSVSTQILASKQELHKLDDHIKTLHTDALKTGKDVNGNPLSAEDKKVITHHVALLLSSHDHLNDTLKFNEAKLPGAKAEFHAAAEKATGNLKPPELSSYDQGAISSAYADAWSKHASKAVTYGVKTFADGQKMKGHPQYPSLTMDLTDLKGLAGKLALAHAEQHTAGLNNDSVALAAAMKNRAALEKQFNDLHKTAQARLDAIRAGAGLKKRALPKLDSPAVKASAAESGYYKSSAYGKPNYGKSASAKSYMLAKVGPKIGVAHKTASDKAMEKLGGAPAAPTASTSKIENVGEPVKLGGDSSISHIPDALKTQLTSDFKSMPNGKYLADPTEDIFDNLVNLAAGHGKKVDGGLSIDQVLKTIDETHSKNLGAVNSGMLHKKVTDWLGTTAGKEYAEKHSTPNPKAVKQISGELDLPEGVTLAPGEKVQKLAGPGPHDTSLKSDAFKAATASQAQEAQDAYMKASGTKWSAQQKSSLKAYTGSAYSMYNGYLRGNGPTSQKVKQDIIDIQSAMMPLPQHTLLKRGTGWPPELAKYQSSPEALLGKTFEEPGFTSTTVAGSGGHFSGQPLQLVIEAPKGTPAAFVNGISHYKDKENEMLLAAGTKFKVISVEKTTSGHTLMRVRIVGDK